MTVKELYEQIEGDYNDALKRLRMEKLVTKFIIKFLDDSSCKTLIDTWESHDEEKIFSAAHAAKGVCINLALPKLYNIADTVTEAMRPGNEELRSNTDIDALMNEFKKYYESSYQAIQAFAAEQ